MKIINFLFLCITALFSLLISAEVFTTSLGVNGAKKMITISVYENLHINDECNNLKEKCIMSFISYAKIAKNKSTNQNKLTTGHPASDFCKSAQGTSEIFIDHDQNQHDYCIFSNGTMIDSWDFYKRFKR